MNLQRHRAVVLTLLVFALAACKDTTPKSADSRSRAPAADELRVIVAYGSEKKTWLEEQARKFEASSPRSADGKRITIDARAMGSGEAMQAIVRGDLKPHVFSPASGVYVTLLNDAWLAAGKRKPLSPAGDPVVLSPVVIATWKPMAEALGWPRKTLGWNDLLRVSLDANGWGTYGHPEWARFKLGHTHPEYSSSGILAVLAEAYAGAGKTRGLTAADLDAKATQTFLANVERAIVHYGKSTGFFADKLLQRGPSYLSAAVLYENLVIESYAKSTTAPFPVVAIYPKEGTFWADHPYAILDADWVGAPERKAAEAFLAFLKARPQQERALALGFRPADPAVPMGAPIDAAHGCDAKQPQTLLDVPDAATLGKLLAVWQSTKRATDVVLVFDKSGSMEGQPLAEAKRGAKAFLDGLHPRDQVTVLAFDNQVYPPTGPVTLGDSKDKLLGLIDGLFAGGGTALYDAVAAAYEQAHARAQADPSRTHMVVVMTDGLDEGSKLQLGQLLGRFPKEGEEPVKIFTIAYGGGASGDVLQRIAESARGSSSKGSVTNIVQVYQDMAAFF